MPNPSSGLILGPRVRRATLRRTLDEMVARIDRPSLAAADPVELVRRYDDPDDQEVVGLIVCMLAYGRVASIKKKANELLQVLGPNPAKAIDAGRRAQKLSGFVYRFQREEDLPRFLLAIRGVRKEYGSLNAAFLASVDGSDADYAPALTRFVLKLEAAVPGPLTRGLRFLLPRPSKTGAAKRAFLYLRWMVRPNDGLDLGAFTETDTAKLIIPLDTHISRLSRYLGLTEQKQDNLRTAKEITAALAALRPEDPLVYDMALCHLGISGKCPRQRNTVLCAGCGIRGACRLGARPKNWPPKPLM